MKFLMQWKYQTVNLNNSSLPPAFCTKYLFWAWIYEHTTCINIQCTPHVLYPQIIKLMQWRKRWKNCWCHLSLEDVKRNVESPLWHGPSEIIYISPRKEWKNLLRGGGNKKGQILVTDAFQKEGVSLVTLLSKVRKVRKAQAQLELNLASYAKNNKKGFYRYVRRKRKVK